MRHGRPVILAWLCIWSAAAAAANAPVRFLNTRDVRIDFHADQSIDAVELFMSADGGRTWRPHPIERRTPDALYARAPEDGRFDFYLVLRNAAGQSAGPSALSEPHARLVIDTRAPTVQMHRATASRLDAERSALRVRLTLIEENLAPDAIRLFVETPSGPRDLGPVTLADRELLASFDADPPLAPDARLRLVVTDLAGNRSSAELERIDVPAAVAGPATDDDRAVEPDVSGPPVVLDDLAWDEAGSGPTERGGRAAALRTQAARFREAGRFPLAAARVEEALELAPDDAGLLTELAGDLLSAQQPERAAEVYGRVLRMAPDHPEALSGLALVEVTRKQYGPAREHLRRLVELTPDDARALLRYGDVEHRLGRPADALSAWRRVLGLPSADPETRAKASKRLEVLGPDSGH